MKVLALLVDAYGSDGGIAQFNRDFLAALAGVSGMQRVDAIGLRPPTRPEAPPPRVTYTALGDRGSFVIGVLRRAVATRRYDIIFCGHLHLAPLAVVLARLSCTPTWLQAHGIEAWQRPSWPQRWAVSQVTLVTAVSRYTRRRLLEWSGLAPERAKVLPNTVGSQFKPGPKPEALARRLGLSGRRVLLTVGRLSASERYKGHDAVLRSLSWLRGRFADIAYVIAGDGDDRSRLETVAREAGVADIVRFLGHVAREQLADLYRLADVFVMPSAGEGFGIVFLEAAACGVPIVAGATDGSGDPAGDGMRGFLADAANEQALHAVLERALTAPLPANAGPFSVKQFSRQVEKLCREVVESAGR